MQNLYFKGIIPNQSVKNHSHFRAKTIQSFKMVLESIFVHLIFILSSQRSAIHFQMQKLGSQPLEWTID